MLEFLGFYFVVCPGPRPLWGVGFGGFKVQGSGVWVQGLGVRVQGLGFRV